MQFDASNTHPTVSESSLAKSSDADFSITTNNASKSPSVNASLVNQSNSINSDDTEKIDKV